MSTQPASIDVDIGKKHYSTTCCMPQSALNPLDDTTHKKYSPYYSSIAVDINAKLDFNLVCDFPNTS